MKLLGDALEWLGESQYPLARIITFHSLIDTLLKESLACLLSFKNHRAHQDVDYWEAQHLPLIIAVVKRRLLLTLHLYLRLAA